MTKPLFIPKRYIILVIICCTIGHFSFAEAVWTPDPKKPMPLEDMPNATPEAHYARAAIFFNQELWDSAAKEFWLIATNFPETSYGQDSKFFLGVAYYQMSELDLANEAFTSYLECQSNPKYFQESIEYKFCIAERFRCGEKKRMFGSKQLPKWSSGHNEAIQIYEEVIPAMPGNEIAEQAFYAKGLLLWHQRDFRGSIEAFQALINRFPKSELTPECYLLINRVFLDQCRIEYQNPDLLALAEINLRRFQQQFPGEERIEQASCDLLKIKEVFARGMYDTACYYERIDQPAAAVIYYQKIIIDFPETDVAQWCRNRLCSLCYQALEDLENFQVQEKESEEEAIDFNL